MNQHSQARVIALAPPVRSLALALAARTAELGYDIEIVQGGRSWSVQYAYYAQGRNALEFVNAKRSLAGLPSITTEENKRITDAPAGYSWHQYFLAFDAAPFDLIGHPDWDESHPAWADMEKIGKELGFECGAGWSLKKRDAPHFQLTGRFPVSPTDEVRALYEGGGVQAVWDAAFTRITTT